MPLDNTGFTPKTLTQIRSDISSKVKLALGNSTDTSPSSRIGQLIDIFSAEMYSAWLALQDTYNSFFPSSSSNVSLDNVVSITNTTRLFATPSTALVYLAGDTGVVVPASTNIQKTSTAFNFYTLTDNTISDDANIIIVSGFPTSGTIVLSWDGESIAAINWDDDIATIKSKIEAHSAITTVTVTGTLDSVTSFHVLFDSESLTSREPTIEENLLLRNSTSLEANAYFSTEESIPVTAVDFGDIVAPVVSLTTIVNPTFGFDAVINIVSGVQGRNRETDADLRVRRTEELQKIGTTTIGGMKQLIAAVPLVASVTLVQNDTDIIDAEGRPPHSVEAFVEGGDNDAVAQAIYDTKPIGIGICTTVSAPNQRTGNYVDVNGENQTMIFSQPVEVPMLIEVNGTKGTDYPTNGDDDIKAALIEYFENISLGQDVLNHLLYTPINTIPGIVTMQILQDTVAGGVPAETNTVISATEIATLIEANITVSMV